VAEPTIEWHNDRGCLHGTKEPSLLFFNLAEGGMPKASERSKHKTGKRPEGQLPLTLDVFQRVRPTILAWLRITLGKFTYYIVYCAYSYSSSNNTCPSYDICWMSASFCSRVWVQKRREVPVQSMLANVQPIDL
jgi:hypothetical protein